MNMEPQSRATDSARARTQDVPAVAGDVEEDGETAVGLVAWWGHEGHAGGAHALVRRVEIVDAEEEAHAAGDLIADRLRLVGAVGSGEQDPGLRADRPHDDPALGPTIVGSRRRIVDQLVEPWLAPSGAVVDRSRGAVGTRDIAIADVGTGDLAGPVALHVAVADPFATNDGVGTHAHRAARDVPADVVAPRTAAGIAIAETIAREHAVGPAAELAVAHVGASSRAIVDAIDPTHIRLPTLDIARTDLAHELAAVDPAAPTSPAVTRIGLPTSAVPRHRSHQSRDAPGRDAFSKSPHHLPRCDSTPNG
jgi:hypothetical protein